MSHKSFIMALGFGTLPHIQQQENQLLAEYSIFILEDLQCAKWFFIIHN